MAGKKRWGQKRREKKTGETKWRGKNERKKEGKEKRREKKAGKQKWRVKKTVGKI